MADFSVGSYYIVLIGSDNVSRGQFTACLMITDPAYSGWKLMSCNPDRSWPPAKGRYGQWRSQGMLDGLAKFYEDGCKDLPDHENHLVFSLYGQLWPPNLTDWDQTKGRAATIDWRMPEVGAPHVRRGNGNWWPLVSGPLLEAVKKFMQEQEKELQEALRDLPVEVASLVDPTGLASLYCAVRASEKGDYLGCAMNLLAAIPLFGKLPKGARVAQAVAKAEGLKGKIEAARRYLQWSLQWTKSAGLAGRGEAKVMNTAIAASSKVSEVERTAAQGWIAERLAKVGHAVSGLAHGALLRNFGWLHRISNAESLGLLDHELKALRMLAGKGIYFVIRSCNPARVYWLKRAQQLGCRLMAKPEWMKAKTIVTPNCRFRGLCGVLKSEAASFRGANPRLMGQLPPGAANNVERLLGEKPVAVYKGNYLPGYGSESMLNHYWVETKDSFILVDHTGAPYTADLDIVTVSGRLRSGGARAPGQGAGPAHPVVTSSAPADDAQFSMHWASEFKQSGCTYPHGYNPFGGFHGGRGGSAAFGQWSPEKREELIVAARGIEGVGDDVACASSWSAWKQFDTANRLGASQHLQIRPDL